MVSFGMADRLHMLRVVRLGTVDCLCMLRVVSLGMVDCFSVLRGCHMSAMMRLGGWSWRLITRSEARLVAVCTLLDGQRVVITTSQKLTSSQQTGLGLGFGTRVTGFFFS